MTVTVTLHIGTKDSDRTFSVKTENKNFINSVVTVNDGVIKEEDITTIQNVMRGAGNDAGILEYDDLNGTQIKNLAELYGFGEYYDLSLSSDKQYMIVTIKKTVVNPNLATIKSDFGIKDNVLVKKGKIPYDNGEDKGGPIPNSSYGADFDSIVICEGETLKIPISEINITGSPRGCFKRSLSRLVN